jgi:quinol-cytochrome oxidoreductase complex cytochrome b subunit
MNWKRFIVASLVIFVVVQAMEFVINEVLMKSAYESLKNLWRPNMASKMWVMYVVGLLVSLLFTYIFIKGREGKGVAEGVRFGIIMWLFVSIPMDLSMWVLLPIPHMLLFKWILFALVEMLVAGILVAVIYKPLAAAKAVPEG